MLKKAASCVPFLRRAYFAEVATKAESRLRLWGDGAFGGGLGCEGRERFSAQAGRSFVVLTYGPFDSLKTGPSMDSGQALYAPRVNKGDALRDAVNN